MKNSVITQRIASAFIALPISIVLLAGNCNGFENSAYGEEKDSTQTNITISSIQIVADFNYFKDCLVGLRYYSGSTLEFVTDQPSEVSEFLSNGDHFSCIEKASKRKSIFVRGLITVK